MVAGPVLPEKSGEHPLEMDHESDTPIVAVTAASEPITERKDLQEVPTDLKIVKGKAVDVKLGKLRAEITELAKERGMDVDDEDYDLSDYMDEEFAEINVVALRPEQRHLRAMLHRLLRRTPRMSGKGPSSKGTHNSIIRKAT